MADMGVEDSKVLAAERGNLSRALVSYSIVAIMALLAGVFTLLSVVIFKFSENLQLVDRAVNIADKVIASFFPLVGAWVGAVVAFYFARDNFIAATQSAQALLRREPVDPLALKSVESAMMPLDKATVQKGSEANLKAAKLQDLLNAMAQKSVSRLPLLLDDDRPFAVVHADRIRQFCAERNKDPAKDTLQAMFDDPEYSKWLPGSYALVSLTTSLADGWAAIQTQKMRMGRLGCRDALVTANGKAEEKVVGYLTDEIINRERAAAAQ